MSGSRSADRVGQMFFNVIQIPCFYWKEADSCVERSWWGGCLAYEKVKKAEWRYAKAY